MNCVITIILLLLFSYSFVVDCCDLESFFNSKQVSVEDSASTSQIIFKGFTTAKAPALSGYFGGGNVVVYTASFELITSYKGADVLETWTADSNYRYHVEMGFS